MTKIQTTNCEKEFRRITGGEQLCEGTPEQIRQKEQRLDGWLDDMKRVREQQLASSLDEEKRRAVADPVTRTKPFRNVGASGLFITAGTSPIFTSIGSRRVGRAVGLAGAKLAAPNFSPS